MKTCDSCQSYNVLGRERCSHPKITSSPSTYQKGEDLVLTTTFLPGPKFGCIHYKEYQNFLFWHVELALNRKVAACTLLKNFVSSCRASICCTETGTDAYVWALDQDRAIARVIELLEASQ